MLLKRIKAVVLAIGLTTLVILIIFFAVGRSANHSVTLTWHAPTPAKEVTVVGYNVYRSVTPGGPYVRIASGVTELTYRDSIVNNPKTYFYVVTSVDAAGHESPYSNEAQAKIP